MTADNDAYREEVNSDAAQLLLWAAEIRRRGHGVWADLIVEATAEGDLARANQILAHAQGIPAQ